MTVGVVYDADFASYQHIGQPQGLIGLTVEVGAASIDLFDQAFAAMFERVIPIQRGSDVPPGLDGVLELSFERMTVYRGTPGGTAAMSISVTYDIKLRASEGEEIAAWSPTGAGYWSTPFLHVASTASRLADGAVRSAVAQFIISFSEPQTVKQWLERRGVQRSAVEAGR